MRITVDYNNLISILENYVESFNDCACCPSSFACERKNPNYGNIDLADCAKFIRDHFLEANC